LSTAHPGKFANVVEPIIGEKMDLPKSLHRVLKKEKHAITIRNKYSYLKAFLMES